MLHVSNNNNSNNQIFIAPYASYRGAEAEVTQAEGENAWHFMAAVLAFM